METFAYNQAMAGRFSWLLVRVYNTVMQETKGWRSAEICETSPAA